MITDDKLKALDDCATAVQRALGDCARAGSIDLDDGLGEPAVCLAIEAQCFVQAWRRLRGKAEGRTFYA